MEKFSWDEGAYIQCNEVLEMNDLTVFEAGMRNPEGTYAKFMESPDREKVEEYLEIMKATMPEDFELILLEKHYVLVSTTPHIVYTQ